MAGFGRIMSFIRHATSNCYLLGAVPAGFGRILHGCNGLLFDLAWFSEIVRLVWHISCDGVLFDTPFLGRSYA